MQSGRDVANGNPSEPMPYCMEEAVMEAKVASTLAATVGSENTGFFLWR